MKFLWIEKYEKNISGYQVSDGNFEYLPFFFMHNFFLACFLQIMELTRLAMPVSNGTKSRT